MRVCFRLSCYEMRVLFGLRFFNINAYRDCGPNFLKESWSAGLPLVYARKVLGYAWGLSYAQSHHFGSINKIAISSNQFMLSSRPLGSLHAVEETCRRQVPS